MAFEVAVQDHTHRIHIRHVDPRTRAEITVVSGTVSIVRGSTTIVTTAAVGVSGSLAYYERSWDAATFPIDTYRADWTLVDGSSVTRKEESFFEVVKRAFRCPIGVSDFSSRYPYLSQLLVSTDLASYLDSAWEEIELYLYGKLGRYPGNVFTPEQFARAAEFWAVADAYRAVARSADSEDTAKADHYRERAMQSLAAASALVRADANDDNIAGPNEVKALSMIKVTR